MVVICTDARVETVPQNLSSVPTSYRARYPKAGERSLASSSFLPLAFCGEVKYCSTLLSARLSVPFSYFCLPIHASSHDIAEEFFNPPHLQI